jgi:hypothetical protein
VVNGDSQCLKRPGGRVNFTPYPWNHLLYYLHQLKGSAYRTLTHYVAGYLTAVTFLAICLEKVSQLALGECVYNIGSRNLLAGVEAHIQRTVLLEAKTTALIIKLKGRQPEVKQDTVHRVEAMLKADRL